MKRLTLDEKSIKKLQETFMELLTKRTLEKKIEFKIESDSVDGDALVAFSDIAYFKMINLVAEFSSEVAWYFVGGRGEGENEYLIDDILVYPQEVTGATVDMDVEGVSNWIFKNSENEAFSRIIGQGHSHVNMACVPSSTDRTHQDQVLKDLGDEDFYIFMIVNKKGDNWTNIVDFKNNVQYEDRDIVIDYGQMADEIEVFINEAHDNVSTKSKYVPANYSKGNKSSYKSKETKSKSGGSSKKNSGSSYGNNYYDDFYDDYSGYDFGYGGYKNAGYGYPFGE